MKGMALMTLAPSQAWVQMLLLVLGIVVVIKSADCLTNGAVGIARRMGVPQIAIGLTIVAIGTSMPEFFVSLMSAVNGTPDLAVGNIVGSNIFNALLIVGVAAMVAPIAILRSTVRKDIPIALFASVLLMGMALDGTVSRVDAALLFVFFVVFVWLTLRGAKGNGGDGARAESGAVNVWKAVCLVALGLLGLVVGSNVFVDNASALARSIGISDAVIGLTIVACGTSLPELATSVVAARKGNNGIAIGNVLGSNVFNILMILGITGLVRPMAISGITAVDLSVMVASMAMLWLFSFTKYNIQRWEGAVLASVFVGYMVWLL